MNSIGLRIWSARQWITRANIRRVEKFAFIALATVGWLPVTAFSLYLGVTEHPMLIVLALAWFFPITILLCVLSIVAIRRYHPLMWIVFIPFLTALYGLEHWALNS